MARDLNYLRVMDGLHLDSPNVLDDHLAQRESSLVEQARDFVRRYGAQSPKVEMTVMQARVVVQRLKALYSRVAAIEELELGLAQAKEKIHRITPLSVSVPENDDDEVLALPSRQELPHPDYRRSRRIETLATATVTNETVNATGVVLNVSEHGVFIATLATLAPASQILVQFALSTRHRVSAEGIVRWVRPWNEKLPDVLPGVGIEILPDELEAKEALSKFVEGISGVESPPD
ncbi:MAG: PilZ domain-containing protein [Myxococcota bacterium]